MRDFVRIWRDRPKVVVSKTLERVDWNSRLVRAEAEAEIERLRAEPGFEMSIGGQTAAEPFIRRESVDEYRVFVQPVTLGAGRPFSVPLVLSRSNRRRHRATSCS